MLFDQIEQGKCLVIAEVAQAHDGSLGTAHAYIDAVAGSADAIKFQTHIAAAESSPQEPWRVKFTPQDATRYDYWRRMEFTEDQWMGLKCHARQRGLAFLSSAFSLEAVELLERVGVDGWKIASGEVSNPVLYDRMARTGLPVLLSTGMSPLREIDRAVQSIQSAGLPLLVFQCTSQYPCPPEKLGLNMLSLFRQRYGCHAGLSDHSGNIYAGLAAVTLGAAAVEVHVTFSRECFGPDVCASVTTDELRDLVKGIRFIERTLRNPVDKDGASAELEPIRAMFMKSVAARVDLPAGTVLTADNLTLRKPGIGIPATRMMDLIGRQVAHAVQAGAFLKDLDLVQEEAAAGAGGMVRDHQ